MTDSLPDHMLQMATFDLITEAQWEGWLCLVCNGRYAAGSTHRHSDREMEIWREGGGILEEQ